MSIIYDALKKTQKNREFSQKVSEKEATKKFSETQVAEKKVNAPLPKEIFKEEIKPTIPQAILKSSPNKPQSKKSVIEEEISTEDNVIPMRHKPRMRLFSTKPSLILATCLFILMGLSTYPRFINHNKTKSNFPKPQSNYNSIVNRVPVTKAPVPVPPPETNNQYAQRMIEDLNFKGVFISDNEKLAMINDESLRLGDRIHGMEIVSIENDKVRLANGKMVLELKASV